MHRELKVLPFTGKNIKAYLPSIARLRLEVLRDYPFLQDKTVEDELKTLKKYTQSPEAIIVVVFDGPVIVGASTGIPLSRESQQLQKPFLEHNLDPASYYYFSESLLLKSYRGRGIGHHFFDLREQHVQHLKKFKHACFCEIDRAADHPKKPEDHFPLNNFWRKRGYADHPALTSALNWKDVGEKAPSDKRGIFWIKDF